MMELWPFTNFHDMNLDWIIRVMKEWNKRLEEFFEGGGIHDFIEGILEEHPEWVTTVMDNSLTSQKFTAMTRLEVVNSYVTPEMFGAVGDGVADDTQALTDALASNKPVHITKIYKITTPITLSGYEIITGDFMYSTDTDPRGIIRTSGCDAFHVTAGTRFASLDNFRIDADNYAAIAFTGSGTVTRNRFANLTVNSKYDITDTHINGSTVTSGITLWNNIFDNISSYIDNDGSKMALDIHSATTSFGNTFNNIVTGDKSVDLGNIRATFSNSNFGFDMSGTFHTGPSANINYVNCNFEDDVDGTATKMFLNSTQTNFTECTFHSRAANTLLGWYEFGSSTRSVIFNNCRWSYKTVDNFWIGAQNYSDVPGAFKFIGHNNSIPAYTADAQKGLINANVGNSVTPYRYDTPNVTTNAFGTFHGRLAYYNGTRWVGDGTEVKENPPYANTEYMGKLWTDAVTRKTYVWLGTAWYDMMGNQYTG